MSVDYVLIASILGAVGICAYAAYRWARRGSAGDLGGVSDQWLAQNRGHSSRDVR